MCGVRLMESQNKKETSSTEYRFEISIYLSYTYDIFNVAKQE